MDREHLPTCATAAPDGEGDAEFVERLFKKPLRDVTYTEWCRMVALARAGLAKPADPPAMPGQGEWKQHCVELEQCALFVDSPPLSKAMTDAAAFFRDALGNSRNAIPISNDMRALVSRAGALLDSINLANDDKELLLEQAKEFRGLLLDLGVSVFHHLRGVQ